MLDKDDKMEIADEVIRRMEKGMSEDAAKRFAEKLTKSKAQKK